MPRSRSRFSPALVRPNRRPIPDPEIETLIEGIAQSAGIQRRAIEAGEILERALFALVNEGARILEERIALRAGDIDIVYIFGYGFPAHRGGPMWYADTIGLKKVYDRISDFHRRHGDIWAPAPLLARLAEQGQSFADFDNQLRSAGKEA